MTTPRQTTALAGLLTLVAALDATPRPRLQEDPRVVWLRDHAVELATIEADDPADEFLDLMPLVEKIGDARVVQLGEQSHGDGTAFLARTRLVRFLHEVMGFDVLAFESGFFEVAEVDAALRFGEGLPTALGRGIYDVWSRSAQMRPLWEYLQESAGSTRPLYLVGFDSQLSSDDSARRIGAQLLDVLADDPQAASTPEERERFLRLCEALSERGAIRVDEAAHLRNQELLGHLVDVCLESPSLRIRHSTLKLSWWRQVLRSLAAQEAMSFWRGQGPAVNPQNIDRIALAPQYVQSGNVRDQAMADNLRWILDHGWPGRKVIVWAANNHVTTAPMGRSSGTLPGEDEPAPVLRAGVHLKRVLGDDLFTVLATIGEGSWASPTIRTAKGELRWQEGRYAEAKPGTFAGLCVRAGLENAVLDVRPSSPGTAWLTEPLCLRQDGFAGGRAVKLHEHCDAVLFLRRMDPSRPFDDE